MAGEMSELTERLIPILGPLDEKEERLAVECAMAHLTTRYPEMADGGYRVIGAEVRLDKPRRGRVPQRLVTVLVADYTARRAHEVAVGAKGRIVGSVVLEGFNAPFLPEEVREAQERAREDERVGSLARRPDVTVAAFVPEPARHAGLRPVGLHYFTADPAGTELRPLATVVVELATGGVVSFRDDVSSGPGSEERGDSRGSVR